MEIGIRTFVVLLLTIIFVACTKEQVLNDPGPNAAEAKKANPDIDKQKQVEVSISKEGEVTTKNIAEGRDLSLYDRGGHFDCRDLFIDKNESHENYRTRIESNLESVREFIWTNWKNKKRGYIRVSFSGVDTNTTDHIFIEPGVDKNWQIEVVTFSWTVNSLNSYSFRVGCATLRLPLFDNRRAQTPRG